MTTVRMLIPTSTVSRAKPSSRRSWRAGGVVVMCTSLVVADVVGGVGARAPLHDVLGRGARLAGSQLHLQRDVDAGHLLQLRVRERAPVERGPVEVVVAEDRRVGGQASH